MFFTDCREKPGAARLCRKLHRPIPGAPERIISGARPALKGFESITVISEYRMNSGGNTDFS